MEAWKTHEVLNQTPPLVNYNLFDTDTALREAVAREGAGWATATLSKIGAELGTAESFELGRLANQYTPVLRAFDARGHRLDAVEFHPAWHALLSGIAARGLHNAPWAD